MATTRFAKRSKRLPSSLAAPVLGIVPENAEALVQRFEASPLLRAARSEALAAYFALASGRAPAGRYWKVDLDALDLSRVEVRAETTPPRIAATLSRGAIACDLATARRVHPQLLERALGTAVDARTRKFASLANAFGNTGAFVYVPAGVSVDNPIEIAYAAGEIALFPHTIVLAEAGARCTVICTLEGGAEGSFVCGIDEIVTGERASVSFASVQTLALGARSLFTRAARPGKDAHLAWAIAELGADLCASTVEIEIEQTGVDAQIAAVFCPSGDQHVDLVSSVDHRVGQARSETIVRSAATGSGQARYLGNINIAAHAQGSNASLRDDALLLSKKAHVDSVPALEIAANDVKAYHGATVGALDEEQIFYMTSRGIERDEAERMIVLGFFEPVIDRFPTRELRERIRAALQAKVG